MSVRPTQEAPGFVARPAWERWLRRQWRARVIRWLHPSRLRRQSARWIVPPKEWSQESADAAIKRGQELAKEYGWEDGDPEALLEQICTVAVSPERTSGPEGDTT